MVGCFRRLFLLELAIRHTQVHPHPDSRHFECDNFDFAAPRRNPQRQWNKILQVAETLDPVEIDPIDVRPTFKVVVLLAHLVRGPISGFSVFRSPQVLRSSLEG
ncbi:MAG TPA: hypothetical protein ENI80_05035 [Acidiferrobacteraceae bacterium]|nr:hypothetical protein [Acidiferrobacteraceae bacterium]